MPESHPYKKERTVALMLDLVAKYLSEELNRSSLITITDCKLSSDGNYATFFISVLPEKEEAAALDFVKRKRSEIRTHLQKESRIGRVPFLEFALDLGEKNRQRVDELLAEDENR